MAFSRTPRKNVGVIGLGIIGSRVATALRSSGFHARVWNRTPRPVPNFLGSPAEVAAECGILQIFVADAAATLEVVEAMAPTLTSSHVVLSHGTIGLAGTQEVARCVQKTGAQFLDAPFTGSKLAAEKRQLVYYVGGPEAAFQAVRPALEASSKAIVRFGIIGEAAVVKVVTNLVSAATAQVLAEALALVRASGIDPALLSKAIENNAMRSGVTDLKLPKMIQGDYEPHFSLKHMFKDVQLGLQMAAEKGMALPATETIAGLLYGGVAKGWGDLDFAALAKAFEGSAK